MEAGLRLDHLNEYQDFLLPRIALFHRFNEEWATRFGVGLGYKTPDPLAVQNTEYPIEQLQPFPENIRAEKSIGYNAEINYKKEFNEHSSLFINQAFFLTQISRPLIAIEQASDQVGFMNADKPMLTRGFDTYIQIEVNDWELYAGYTYTIAERKYLPANQFIPLTPRNRWAFVVTYVIPAKWRFGLEGSYTGEQYRDNDTKTPSYMFMAGMIERKLGKAFSIVLNCENLLDERQSRHEALYTGPVSNPGFKPLWAPIDGRVVNLSIRWDWARKK
jgi:iron complex outermembrane receptor protein/outer membrane receptor for ferrienterochelin and colicins